MPNRREFLKTSAALAIAGTPFATAFAAGASTLPLQRLVFDVRFAESAAIAEHARLAGIPLAPIADDLMTLWYDELDLAWRTAPMALAGVTLEDALFVLETFALDRGMHVVYRGEHGVVENGRIVHRLTGPEALLRRMSPPPTQWEAALASALTQCPLGAPPTSQVEIETAGAALSLRDVPLHSWIIAPRAAVASRAS